MKRASVVAMSLLLLAGCTSEEPDVSPPTPPDIQAPAQGAVLTELRVAVEGSAESGAWVEVYVDGTYAGAGTRAIAGSFAVPDVDLGQQGAHALTATATDEAGNGSGHSAPVVVYVDVDAPTAAIWSPRNGAVLTTGAVEVVGVAEGAASVSLEVDERLYGDQTVEAGIFRFAGVGLGGEGEHSLRVRARDHAGNQGAWGTFVYVTVDSTAPASPEITSPVAGSYLVVAQVSVRGRAPSGTTVEAYVDSALTAAAAIAVGDTFEVPDVPLGGDGLKSLSVVAVDSADNRSGSSPSVLVRVDTTPPLAPMILYPESDALLRNDTVAVRGIADDGGSVTLWINGQESGQTVSHGWEFTFASVALREGVNRLVAEVTDLGNRRSDPSDTVRISVDTVAPPLRIDFPPPGYQCATESVEVRGLTEAGVALWVNGRSTEVQTDGSFATRTALTPGPNLIVVSAADSAGNETTSDVAVESYPTEPTLELLWPPDSLLTDSTAVTVVGTASAWARVEVQGAAVGLDSAGRFSARVALTHGSNVVQVVAASPVGPMRSLQRWIVSDVVPLAPAPEQPPDGDPVDHGRPRLVVTNGFDPDGDGLDYSFVLYYDVLLTQEARRLEGISAGPSGTTAWTVAPPLSLDGRDYWWRCGVTDGFAEVWSETWTFSLPDIGSNAAHRYLGFGDSITKGSQWYNNWWIPQGLAYEPELRIALTAFFGQADLVRRWIDGAVISDVRDSLGGVLSEETPAYCLIHVGTLDVTHGWYEGGIPADSLARMKAGYGSMIAVCRQRLTIPVLSTVAPLSPEFFPGTYENVEALNEEIRNLAGEEEVALADHYTASMAYLAEHPDKTLADLLSGDGRHLSDEGYSVMAAEWFRAITGREPGETQAAGGGILDAGRAGTAR